MNHSRALLAVAVASLAACSHAERSATTPAPKAAYIASTNVDAEAAAAADRFCRYYNAEPPVLVERRGTLWHFECSQPPTWPRTMLDEVF
jgi:hypothetical protein